MVVIIRLSYSAVIMPRLQRFMKICMFSKMMNILLHWLHGSNLYSSAENVALYGRKV